MITRRAALRTLLLTTGAWALAPSPLEAQDAIPAEQSNEVFKLPPLGYDYDALEPFIDAETMKLHHNKHHAAYVSKLNQLAGSEPGIQGTSVEKLLAGIGGVPESIRDDVRNFGGGHANHSLLWKCLRKSESGGPSGELAEEIARAYGDMAEFHAKLSAAAANVFGSGWAWLTLRDAKLQIETTSNQDSPLMTGGFPLLGVDLWEHAYYLKYHSSRGEYVEAMLKVVNWPYVSARYTEAMKGITAMPGPSGDPALNPVPSTPSPSA